jgi:hypothetical protein
MAATTSATPAIPTATIVHSRETARWAKRYSVHWGVLWPYIEHDRAASGDPTIYRWFEWVELELRRIDVRRTGNALVFDPATRASAIAVRIAMFRSKLAREAANWSGSDPRHTVPLARHQTDAVE